ncbi:putative vacuolar membrane transporter for cationic amino acids [Coemansia sp. BCRC 34490]|nr:putative vacuolar membrane transporter for cationic amino acids [Coemansia sp. BCRC 34490]
MLQYLSALQRQTALIDLLAQKRQEDSRSSAGASSTLLSDFFGYVSFGCWLVVLLPQLWLNYKRKSSDGLSLGFILMWLAGDFADWYGAYIGRLLLPAILIAFYFVITDVVLLSQMFCYRKSDDDIFGANQLPEGMERPPLIVRRGRRACRYSGPENVQKRMEEYREAEREVLLERGFTTDETSGDDTRTMITTYGAIASIGSDQNTPTPSNQRMAFEQALSLMRTLGSEKSGRAIAISALVLLAVVGVGVGSRAVLSLYPQSVADIISQVFGYISAAMFFVAYIPQIAWNFTAQSTEGLSASMFVFTVLGNVTYCLSILSISTDREFLITYAPWLAGAAGTLGFETLVLWQCYFYSRDPEDDDNEEETEDNSNSNINNSSNSASDRGQLNNKQEFPVSNQSGGNNCSSEEDSGKSGTDTTSMISRSRRRRQRRRHLRRHSNSIGIAPNNPTRRNGKEPSKKPISMSLQI